MAGTYTPVVLVIAALLERLADATGDPEVQVNARIILPTKSIRIEIVWNWNPGKAPLLAYQGRYRDYFPLAEVKQVIDATVLDSLVDNVILKVKQMKLEWEAQSHGNKK